MSNERPTPSQIYLIDSDSATRRTFIELISSVGLGGQSYESGRRFLSEYRDTGAACIVMEMRLADMSGLQLIEHLHNSGIFHPILVVSGCGEIQSVVSAFRCGAIDFLEKPVTPSLLLDRIQRAVEVDRLAREKRMFQLSVRQRLDLLSNREQQIMRMLISGQSNKEIAWKLQVSHKTIAAHRANLLAKMKVESLAELVTQLVSSGVHYLVSDPVPQVKMDDAADFPTRPSRTPQPSYWPLAV